MATTIEASVFPLVEGVKLARAEFLRRWEAQPEVKNAELIEGIVYMVSPVSVAPGDMHADVGGWISTYKLVTPGIDCGFSTTSFLLEDTPQPDLNLRIQPEYGGGTFAVGKYIAGIPELLAEICRSSTAYDLNVKLDLYQTAQVPE
jgi:hypothetical protein